MSVKRAQYMIMVIDRQGKENIHHAILISHIFHNHLNFESCGAFLSLNFWNIIFGYVDVGDGCWKQFVFGEIKGCGWPMFHIEKVTNKMILPQHNVVTNTTVIIIFYLITTTASDIKVVHVIQWAFLYSQNNKIEKMLLSAYSA